MMQDLVSVPGTLSPKVRDCFTDHLPGGDSGEEKNSEQ